jgi:hypothetical protein
MVRYIRAAAMLGAVVLLGVCAAPAPAAKGVKKNGEHHVHGKIVAVHHGKNGHGTVTIHVTHHKHKKAPIAGQQAAVNKRSTHTFTVNHHTHVVGAHNGRHGLAALHAGEHVTIAAHHNHADRITIHHPAGNKVAKR